MTFSENCWLWLQAIVALILAAERQAGAAGVDVWDRAHTPDTVTRERQAFVHDIAGEDGEEAEMLPWEWGDDRTDFDDKSWVSAGGSSDTGENSPLRWDAAFATESVAPHAGDEGTWGALFESPYSSTTDSSSGMETYSGWESDGSEMSFANDAEYLPQTASTLQGSAPLQQPVAPMAQPEAALHMPTLTPVPVSIAVLFSTQVPAAAPSPSALPQVCALPAIAAQPIVAESGKLCPFCKSDPNSAESLAAEKTRTRRRRDVPRKRQRFGRWWRKAGFNGPPYCQRCSEIFRDHLMRQAPNSAQCSRVCPCFDCARILPSFTTGPNGMQDLWDRIDAQNSMNKEKQATQKNAQSSSEDSPPPAPLPSEQQLQQPPPPNWTSGAPSALPSTTGVSATATLWSHVAREPNEVVLLRPPPPSLSKKRQLEGSHQEGKFLEGKTGQRADCDRGFPAKYCG